VRWRSAYIEVDRECFDLLRHQFRHTGSVGFHSRVPVTDAAGCRRNAGSELGELLGRSSRGTLSIEEAAGAQIKKKMSYSKANPRGFYSLPICDEDHMAACGPSC